MARATPIPAQRNLCTLQKGQVAAVVDYLASIAIPISMISVAGEVNVMN